MSEQGAFRLNVRQRAQLNAIERSSFQRFCYRVGVGTAEKEAALLERFHDQARALQAQGVEFARTLLSITDYWDAIHFATAQDSERVALDISEAAPFLRVDYAYLEALAKTVGLPDPRKSLYDFLLAIPQVTLFDTEFNAFVNQHSLIEDIPCVCVYDQLLSFIPSFVDLLTPTVFSYRIDGSADPASEPDCHLRASNSAFMQAFENCLELLEGESDEVSIEIQPELLSSGSLEAVTRHAIITVGAQDFVWHHEYGHLLSGHLQSDPACRLEFEADEFAFNMLSATHEERDLQWVGFGVVLTLYVLVILDAIRGNISRSHPPAVDRLKAFIRDSPIYTALASRLVVVCNPSLKRWGQFTINDNF